MPLTLSRVGHGPNLSDDWARYRSHRPGDVTFRAGTSISRLVRIDISTQIGRMDGNLSCG
jgi:hypothetical protein